MPRLRVAVDVGGTFTDVCVLDEETGAVRVAKVPVPRPTRSRASWRASRRATST